MESMKIKYLYYDADHGETIAQLCNEKGEEVGIPHPLYFLPTITLNDLLKLIYKE